MRTLALCCAVFAGPASADTCGAVWASLTQAGDAAAAVRGTVAAPEGDWGAIEDVVLDLPGAYANDWRADRVRLRGSAWPWLAARISGTDGAGVVPEDLEVEASGLRLVLSTGAARGRSVIDRGDADVGHGLFGHEAGPVGGDARAVRVVCADGFGTGLSAG